MIINYVKSGVLLLIAIILFFQYNSGRGGALGSVKKRLTYLFSVISFIAFIFFLAKAYYYKDNQNNKQVTQELIKEYSILENEISLTNDTSILNTQKQQVVIRNLINQLNGGIHQEYDIYFNILIGLLTAFLGWVIGFTFRNRILG